MHGIEQLKKDGVPDTYPFGRRKDSFKRIIPTFQYSTVFHSGHKPYHLQEADGMGKGDIRTRRGKIWRGTTGKTRPKKKRNKEKEK